MKKDDKVFDVLVEIIRNFMDNGDKNIQELEKSIVESLIAKGYVMEEINDLLDGVFNLMNLDNKEFTLRLLTEEEMPNFSDEGKAYLIDLKNNYILSEEDFEKTIFKALGKDLNTKADMYAIAKPLATMLGRTECAVCKQIEITKASPDWFWAKK